METLFSFSQRNKMEKASEWHSSGMLVSLQVWEVRLGEGSVEGKAGINTPEEA